MATFATLHWAISQAIFVVYIDFYDDQDQMQYNGIISCGYSNIGIIAAIFIGGISVLVVFAFGFRRYQPSMPMAAGCSAVISAACHPAENDEDVTISKVMWGVVDREDSGQEEYTRAHCCITSLPVSEPIEGVRYS